MKVALIQMNPTVGALADNAEAVEGMAQRAAEAGAELAVFPELSLSGYPPEDLILKDHFLRDCRETAKALATRLPPAMPIILGCPWLDESMPRKVYNAALVIVDGVIDGVYRKMLLPNYGVFDEKRVFSVGETPMVYKVGKHRVGVQICEDSWFPEEGPCATLRSNPPDFVVNLSASPYHRGKLQTRIDALGSSARYLSRPLLHANLVGGQDELVFDGASLALNAEGKPMARAARFKEEMIILDVSRGNIQPGSSTSPTLEDREEVYAALTLGLRDYVEKNRFKKVIVALSGGIDSALVVTIAVDALGPDRVIGLTMPSQFSSEVTKSDARQLAENLGVELHELEIQTLFDTYLESLAPSWADLPTDTTEENLQARIRGNLVMAFSNKFGWLVLTTGNKSEFAVGYCTLYGDMVGGFAVIKDVPKTLVWDLSKWRNLRDGVPVIPPSIIERAPSAELRPGQKDTDNLPPYEVLDSILALYVEEDASLDGIVAAGFDPNIVTKVTRLVDINEYKRRQAPPGIKITPKAFGRDRRLPITNAYRGKIQRSRSGSPGEG